MLYRRRYSTRRLGAKFIAFIIAMVVVSVLYFLDNRNVLPYDKIFDAFKISSQQTLVDADFSVHYIDVGQGDCELIKTKDKTVLIDSGEKENSQKVIAYLKSQKITNIDYLIGTHPHSDHIGGMPDIINSFEIGKVIVPKICDDMVPTTKTYTDFLNAVATKGLKLTPAVKGDVFDLDDKSKMTILSPESDRYDNLNNYSVVCRITNGNNSFLFMGDAEKEIEGKLLSENALIDSDVLKVGHHGSDTSSTLNFISDVSPKYCVISVGAGNKYNHPSSKALERIKKYCSKVYRTDLQGNIVCKSDSNKISFEFEKSE